MIDRCVTADGVEIVRGDTVFSPNAKRIKNIRLYCSYPGAEVYIARHKAVECWSSEKLALINAISRAEKIRNRDDLNLEILRARLDILKAMESPV